jgi:hypothetical protein
MDENLVVIEEPKYQEFILKPEDFAYWEGKWWDRVELYYSKN